MKNTLKFALSAVLLSAAPIAAADTMNCLKLSESVKAAVVADSSQVLRIVATSVAANESCACEIVKAAIIAADADEALVGKIVSTAILEAPSEARMITQCAIATAPDAIAVVLAVATEEESSSEGDSSSEVGPTPEGTSAEGGSSSEGGSGAFSNVSYNPLNTPFQSSVITPTTGSADVRTAPEFFLQPVEDDPSVTAPMPDSSIDG
jgi:hypothetical protein